MSLFNEFNETNAKAWKQKIQVDLKGLDYNDTLVSENQEKINTSPFYHQDNYHSIISDTNNSSSKIAEKIIFLNAKDALIQIENGLKSNVNNYFVVVKEKKDIELLLTRISKFKNSKFCFCLEFCDVNIFRKISQQINTSFCFDPIKNFTAKGKWILSKKDDLNNLNQVINNTKQLILDFTVYKNCGANAVQQIAYSLAHLNEYLNENILKNDTNISLIVSIGNDYFTEIAKFKSFRILVKKLLNHYNIKGKIKIIAQPSIRNKTIYDYNVNLLRTTTESMSALLGNVDTIINSSYDEIYKKTNEFGTRIARNQLHILKEESYFDKAKNASEGSYYIEFLTKEITQKSLDLFKDIEKNGGLIKQLMAGTIQRKIEEVADKELKDIEETKKVLIGTTKYQNKNEKMNQSLELDPFLKNNKRKTIIKPLIVKRLSENIEKKRLEQEHKLYEK